MQLPGLLLAVQQASNEPALGHGVEWRLESAWPLEPRWVVVVGVTSIVLLALLQLGGHRWFTRRQAEVGALGRGSSLVLWILRSLVLVVICWMVGGWRIARYETDLPELVVLIDQSGSMRLPATKEETTRGQASRFRVVTEFLGGDEGATLRQFAERYNVKYWAIGEAREVLPRDVDGMLEALQQREPSAEASRLGDFLREAVLAQRGRSTAGVVLLSDGIVTDGVTLATAASQAQSQNLPVFIGRVGSTEHPPQITITELLAESTAMVGDEVTIVARIQWSGDGGVPLRPRLIDQRTGETLATAVVRQPPATAADVGQEAMHTALVPLSFIAKRSGVGELQVRVDALPGEVALEDNVASVVVDIRDDSFRVLLIQGEPSYEFRFLKHLLERATNQDGTRPLVELTSVLQAGDPKYAAQDRSAQQLPPVDDETFQALDLVILSDCDPAGLGLSWQQRLVEYVSRRGVSLVVVAGPKHLPMKLAGTPLAGLLPVDPADVSPPVDARVPLGWRLTPVGRATPNLMIGDGQTSWEQAPPIYWVADIGQVRPGARVLLATDQTGPNQTGPNQTGPNQIEQGRPIVLHQLVGSGQVWLQLTDETFQLTRGNQRDDLHQRYWLQLIRALARRRQTEDQQPLGLDVVGERFRAGTDVPYVVNLNSVLAAAAGGSVEVAVVDAQGQAYRFTAMPDTNGAGRFSGVMVRLPAGSYRAVVTRPVGNENPPSDTFVIRDSARELSETIVDVAALQEVAEKTGGAVVDLAESPHDLLEVLPPGRAVRIKPMEPEPIWNHWGVACLLFGLLSTEWILRRRWGAL